MKYEPKSKVLEKAENFAVNAIGLYQELQGNREFILSKQFLRSATSIGANISEAVAAQSVKDFIHKLSIARKEAHETCYWLRLLSRSEIVKLEYSPYNDECEEIIRMLTSIIITTKSNSNL